ncbi:hypothetical protein [Thermomonas sp. HDW16]|uniref:hypothetical protein n=1 Tax=Thermomonas sp. HDW16 TaxID=2714945 RepID=UPI001408917C|nr:hypothetical protein [Thermomonas sp. HDW16]QIL19976.1 hypothetical protein G7079_04090 [Thermomonas sp. HDW16]
MSNNINVSLDTSVTPNVLDVHDHGHIHIDKKTKPQTITWNLNGVLTGGEFVPMSDPEPGFQWVTDPPPSSEIFGEPARGSNGNSMSITDTHSNGDSDGRWVYRLCVLYNHKVYCTETSIAATVKDPIIINH